MKRVLHLLNRPSRARQLLWLLPILLGLLLRLLYPAGVVRLHELLLGRGARIAAVFFTQEAAPLPVWTGDAGG